MSEMLAPSFEKLAFLGEKAKDQKFFDKVNKSAVEINKILNPIDDVAERQANGKGAKLVEGLAEGKEWKCDSVQSLVEASKDDARPANKDIAEKRLDVLANSIYIAAKYGENPEVRDAIESLDGTLFDNALPDSLKGVGSRIVEIATDREITNLTLKTELKKLDRRTEILRTSGAVSDGKMSEILTTKILELSELVDDLDDRGYDELTRVSAYLGSEVERLEMKVETDSLHSGLAGLDSEARARLLAQEMARSRAPRGPNDGETEYSPYEASYDMTKERFVEMEYNMQPIRWYDERPPAWFDKKNMNSDERELIDLRLKLLNAAANKVYLRNRDIEKLRNNYPEVTEHDFKLLWEKMPGFKEALTGIVSDLCEEYTDNDGRILLRLKTQGTGDTPFAINKVVKDKVEHFYRYKDDYSKTLDNANVLTTSEKRKLGKIEADKLVAMRKTEAVSAAWNFLYVGDSVESWDYFRELKPTVCVSDKLRTMDHPMIKALGKWGVWKGYQTPGEVVAAEGQEEPFISGPLSSWILDRIKYEPNFKQRLTSGDLKDMLPRTMVVSMIESTAIGKGENKMSLGSALLHGRMDVISEHFTRNDTDKNLMQPHNDMVQGGEFILNLIKGKIQYAEGKNDSAFVSDFVENTSLIRQEPNIPLVGGGLGTIGFVDKPEFFAWAITIACGFDSHDKIPLPNARSLGTDYDAYDLAMKQLIEKITVRSSVDKKKVLQMLAADGFVSTKRRQMENTRDRFKRA